MSVFAHVGSRWLRVCAALRRGRGRVGGARRPARVRAPETRERSRSLPPCASRAPCAAGDGEEGGGGEEGRASRVESVLVPSLTPAAMWSAPQGACQAPACRQPLPEPRDRPVLPSGPAAAFGVHPRRTSSSPCTGRWDLHPESSASCALPSVRSSFGAACDATSASRLRRACWGQGSPSGSLSLHWSSASFPERHGWPCSVCRPHPLSSNRLCELFAFESLGMSSRL